MTTGGSTLAALDAIVEFGGVVVGAACLLDRGGELGAALSEANDGRRRKVPCIMRVRQ